MSVYFDLCFSTADDFIPGVSSSRLKVEVSGKTLTVKVDPKHTNSWTDCAQVRDNPNVEYNLGEGALSGFGRFDCVAF